MLTAAASGFSPSTSRRSLSPAPHPVTAHTASAKTAIAATRHAKRMLSLPGAGSDERQVANNTTYMAVRPRREDSFEGAKRSTSGANLVKDVVDGFEKPRGCRIRHLQRQQSLR